MNEQNSTIDAVTISDIFGQDTWNRRRSHEELRTFIMSRHNVLAEAES